MLSFICHSLVAQEKIENTRDPIRYLLNVEWDRAFFYRKNPGEHPYESFWFAPNPSRSYFHASLHLRDNFVYDASAQCIGG